MDRVHTVIVKSVSSACNQKCTYCINLACPLHREGKGVMTTGTARSLMEGVVSLKVPKIKFIWHGGEPTLRGVEFYREVVNIQQGLMSKGEHPVFRNDMQTNATLVDDTWAEFFKKLKAEHETHSTGAVMQLLNTHPTTDERISRLEGKWRDLSKRGPPKFVPIESPRRRLF